jgi:hypothetical protein
MKAGIIYNRGWWACDTCLFVGLVEQKAQIAAVIADAFPYAQPKNIATISVSDTSHKSSLESLLIFFSVPQKEIQGLTAPHDVTEADRLGNSDIVTPLSRAYCRAAISLLRASN